MSIQLIKQSFFKKLQQIKENELLVIIISKLKRRNKKFRLGDFIAIGSCSLFVFVPIVIIRNIFYKSRNWYDKSTEWYLPWAFAVRKFIIKI
jgi:hypothetical protein